MAAQQQPSPVPSWLRPLTSGRNFALVVERLRRAIEVGELKTGEKLPSEPELAGLLGISRSAVREALKVLELSGYLEVRRGYGGGTFVQAGPAEEFTTVSPPPLPAVSVSSRQLLEVRTAVEPYAASLAASCAPNERDRLEHLANAAPVDEDRPAEVLRATFDFHLEIARTGANPVFVGLLEALRPAAYWAMRQSVSDRQWRSQVALEHEAIAAAIAAGDQRQSEELMRAHVVAEMSSATAPGR